MSLNCVEYRNVTVVFPVSMYFKKIYFDFDSIFPIEKWLLQPNHLWYMASCMSEISTGASRTFTFLCVPEGTARPYLRSAGDFCLWTQPSYLVLPQ